MTEPAPWDLPETVHLPGGKKFSGCRARVYWLLKFTQAKGYQHPMDTESPTPAPAGWTPIHTIRRPWAGGAQGDRRLRELRLDFGLEVERRSWAELGGPADSETPLYRIVKDSLSPCAEEKPQAGPQAPPPPSRHGQILPGVRLWRCVGKPRGAVKSLRVDPGLPHVLSPSAATVETAKEMGSVDEAQKVFLLELRKRWSTDSQDFQRQITGASSLVLWVGDPENWLFLEVAMEVLVSLGAVVAGDWEEVAA